MPSNTGETEPPLRGENRPGGRNPSTKVGQLLVDAGLLKQQDLEQSLSIAKESKQPVGRILVGFEHISQGDLEQALKAQTMIASGLINQRTAAQALRQASITNQRLESILAEFAKVKPATRVATLSDLLLRADYISSEVHAFATQKSLESNVPFGKTLLVTKQIIPRDLRNSLLALFLLNKQALSENKAIQSLHTCRKDGVDLSGALKSLKMPADFSKLESGAEALLLAAGVITDNDQLTSLETAVNSHMRLMDVYLGKRLVLKSLADDASEISKLVQASVIVFDRGADLIRAARSQGASVAVVARNGKLFADNDTQSKAVDFLIDSKFLERNVVERAVLDNERLWMGRSRSLVASGVVKSEFLVAVSECLALVQLGEINEVDGIRVLRECRKSNLPFLKALASVGVAPKSVAANVLGQFEEAPHHSFIQTEIMGWIKYPGFMKMAFFAIATPLLAGSILKWVHIEQWGIAFAILFLALIVYFVADGFLLRENTRAKVEKEKDRLQNAGDTKSRLLGRKNKLK